MSAVESLAVVVSVDEEAEDSPGDKGIFSRPDNQNVSIREIPLMVLQENLNETIDGLRKLFQIDNQKDGGFPLKQVQVSFEITASGKIALLGTSASLAGRGAITLTFGG
jgi:hypothetical protein